MLELELQQNSLNLLFVIICLFSVRSFFDERLLWLKVGFARCYDRTWAECKSILRDDQEHFDCGFAPAKAYTYKCKFQFI